MVIKDEDIIVMRNGDGSITLSYLCNGCFIDRTYMFYSLKDAKKLFKKAIKEKIQDT